MKKRFDRFGAAKANYRAWCGMPSWVSVAGGIMFLLICQVIQAAPFRDLVVPFTQPDGTRIQVKGTGDEFYAVFETMDGYTVVFDPALKAYCFARLAADGHVVSTGIQVHQRDAGVLGLAKHVRISSEVRKEQVISRYQKWDNGMQTQKRWTERKAAMRAQASGLVASPPTTTTVGNKTGLCLLIDFDDDPATVPQAEIVNFCNGDNYSGFGNNGSVKKYYQDVSNGMLNYSNVVTAYIRIPSSLNPKSFYNDTTKDCGDQANLLIRDALTIMMALPNYTTEILPALDSLTVDGNNQAVAFNVFYSGDNGGVWMYGLWPHSWVLQNVGPISLSAGGKQLFKYQISNIGTSLELGTFCHENGHMLCGYPDIYDYDYDSTGGAGDFCLMDSGGHGQNPVQVCAYLKRASGWATTTEVDSATGVLATLSAGRGTNFNHFYRFQKPGVPTEYFLLECRNASGRDAFLPASGIAIWHIDELGDRDNQSLTPNSEHKNYECTLVQADDEWHFERNVNSGDSSDLFFNGNSAISYSNEFSDNSSPDSQWWDGSSSGANFHDFSDKATTMSLVIGNPSYTSLAYVTNKITGGNGNGMIDFNECNNLSIVVTNTGTVTATGVQGILVSTTPGVFIAQPSATFPDVPAMGSASSRTVFKVSTTPAFVCGTTIRFSLILKSDQGMSTNQFRIATGTVGKALVFGSTTPVAIPDFDRVGITSPVSVTNVIAAIAKVTVSVFIEHTFSGDLMLELIAPDGRSVLLASHEGSGGNNFGESCDGVRTTFDDDAFASISQGFAPFLGSYKPEQMLASVAGRFGTNVNGIWKLHVVDDIGRDVGALQCWSLAITPSYCLDGGGECPGVDLSVDMVAQPNPAAVSSPLTYTLVVSNAGPSTAKGVLLNQSLPLTETNGVIIATATLSQGSVSPSGDLLSYNLGNILAGGSVTATVVVIPRGTNVFSSTATVGSTSTDYNPGNNWATVTTTVLGSRSDLGVSMSSSPDPVLAGGELTYRVTVVNNGPSPATNVIVTNFLPATVTSILPSSSQGVCYTSGNTVMASLGVLGTNTAATVSIKVTPLAVGQITASAVVLSDMMDPVPNNNRATVITTVGPATDLAVSIDGRPNPVLVGSNLTYNVTVVNRGPSQATDVSLTYTLPNGITLLSAVPSQGTLNTTAPGFITGNLGTLASGGSAIITIVVKSPKAATLVAVASVTAGQSDPNLANNTATNTSVAALPVVTIGAGSRFLVSESVFPANGVIDSSETVTVLLGLTNSGTIKGNDVVAVLQTGGGVMMPETAQTNGALPGVLQSYGDIAQGTVVSQPFTFTASSTNDGTIHAVLLVQSGTNKFSVPFTFVLPSVTTFSNTNAITIPDNGFASPYPAEIVVSGVSGTVSKITASLVNFSHTFPHDVNVLLVHPNGRKSVLMSHTSSDGGAVNHQTITFDNSAVLAMPAKSQLAGGSYRPAGYQPYFDFTNAPAGPYQADMSVFSGIDANGTWLLYVLDDSTGDLGNIAEGWNLAITSINPVNPVADLAVTVSPSATQALIGQAITFTLNVTNSGPSSASNVVLTNSLPSGLKFVSSSMAGITNGQQVAFDLGTLPEHGNTTLTITALVLTNEAFSDTAVVSSSEIDLNTANNTAQANTAGALPSADLAISITDFPATITTDMPLTYTVLVTNSGPNDALKVVLQSLLPAGSSYSGSSSSQGTSYYTNVVSGGVTNGVIYTELGTIPSGSVALQTVTVSVSTPMVVTNTVAATTTSSDIKSGNNSAGFVTTIVNPAPIIVAAGSKLVAESLAVNGAIDNGETVTMEFRLSNRGTRSTTNLTATLVSANGVATAGVAENYGAIGQGLSLSRPFTFTASGAPGATLTVTLALTDGGASLGNITYVFAFPSQGTFANTGRIIIPDSGPATPYPSTIQVSGVTGLVGRVTVTLNEVTHAFSRDINAVLVGPAGQKAVLMSHAGGAHSLTNVTLTFSEAAAQMLSVSNQIVSGTYLPSKFGTSIAYPGVGIVGGDSLDAFNYTNPNGIWTLYIVDDSAGDAGVVASGWSLALQTVQTVNPAADISVVMQAASRVLSQSYITNTITVQNNGPFPADHVVVTNVLPVNATLVSANSLQGDYSTNTSGLVSCDFGRIAPGTGGSLSVVVLYAQPGKGVTSSSVTSDAADLNQVNNSVQQSIEVIAPRDSKLTAVYNANVLQLTLVGQSGLSYAVQSSTNLTDWSGISTNVVSPDGQVLILDSTATNSPYRFFRAIRLP